MFVTIYPGSVDKARLNSRISYTAETFKQWKTFYDIHSKVSDVPIHVKYVSDDGYWATTNGMFAMDSLGNFWLYEKVMADYEQSQNSK